MSDQSTVNEIQQLLESIKDPETGRPLGKTKQIKSLRVTENKVEVVIGLTNFAKPLTQEFQNETLSRIRDRFPNVNAEIKIVEHDRAVTPLGTVGLTARAVVAVGSGKGGVGKSTVATTIALALHRAGCKVGLLDTDVYGPSIPQLTGVRGHLSKQGEKIDPLYFDGMPIMSIGFMVPPDQAVIWRGPMLHSAVQTFVRDVAWGELDYLIIDMPPGTGDVALSLSQMLPLTGAVIVCTPQEVALIDAIKAVAMFNKVNIPVLGLIENMSGFLCPDNGKSYDIFGKGGARQFAQQAQIPFLGEIPIHIPMRERGDSGQMSANFDDPQIAPFLDQIAYQLCKSLAHQVQLQPPLAQLPVLS